MQRRNVTREELESCQAYDWMHSEHTGNNDQPDRCHECGVELRNNQEELCDTCFNSVVLH